MKTRLVLPVLVLGAACSSAEPASKSDAQYKSDVTTSMQSTLGTSLTEFRQAAEELRAAAPEHAWDKTADAPAIAAMKIAWTKARAAYERTEGALAPIFPELDAAVDERYDGFLAELPAGDDNLFDDQGVTGMHAVERILFSDVTPATVTTFEKTLPGYKAAAFPATGTEATDFKTKLLPKLVTDIQTMESEWTPAHIDLGGAFQGLIGLMNEQREKVNKASDGKEESRYAQTTLLDLRNNLAGTKRAYLLFQPWIVSKTNAADPKHAGPNVDRAILAGFDALDALYKGYAGDAIPQPPATWSSDAPSAADLETPFGKLWKGVHEQADPSKDGSIVDEMNDSATLLGFPQFKEE